MDKTFAKQRFYLLFYTVLSLICHLNLQINSKIFCNIHKLSIAEWAKLCYNFISVFMPKKYNTLLPLIASEVELNERTCSNDIKPIQRDG